jgi:hypothetical protein
VLVNVTVANTAPGPAFLAVWGYGQTQPTASALNWNTGGQQVANAVVVPVCAGTCDNDLTMIASSATDVIVDVMGYFRPPAIPAVELDDSSSATISVPANAALGLVSVFCIPPTVLALGSCRSSSGQMVLTGAYLEPVNGWTCEFTNNSALSQTATVSARCGDVPARAQ